MHYYLDSKKRYDAIKLHRVLNDSGIPCSIKRVQRHMKRLGIHSVVVRKYNYKSNQGKVPRRQYIYAGKSKNAGDSGP